MVTSLTAQHRSVSLNNGKVRQGDDCRIGNNCSFDDQLGGTVQICPIAARGKAMRMRRVQRRWHWPGQALSKVRRQPVSRGNGLEPGCSDSDPRRALLQAHI